MSQHKDNRKEVEISAKENSMYQKAAFDQKDDGERKQSEYSLQKIMKSPLSELCSVVPPSMCLSLR